MPPEEVLCSLKAVKYAIDRATSIRNQAMAYLSDQGVSYRDIAEQAGIDHSTVGKIVRNLERVDNLETLLPTRPMLMFGTQADTLNALPEDVIPFMLSKVSDDDPPVTEEELQQMWVEAQSLRGIPKSQMPHASIWMIEEIITLLRHCHYHRQSLRLEETASIYRRGLLAQQWRIAEFGIDILADMRGRWMSVFERLAAEAKKGQERQEREEGECTWTPPNA